MNAQIVYGEVGEFQEENIRKQDWHRPKSRPIRVYELERYISPIECEFVIDEIDGFIIFCSERTSDGKPYCSEHINEMPSIKKLASLIEPLKHRIKEDGKESNEEES